MVHQALKAGFTGIDTAAQPKHYQEDLVGEGVRDAIREVVVRREDLYVGTLPPADDQRNRALTIAIADPNQVYVNTWPRSQPNAIQSEKQYLRSSCSIDRIVFEESKAHGR